MDMVDQYTWMEKRTDLMSWSWTAYVRDDEVQSLILAIYNSIHQREAISMSEPYGDKGDAQISDRKSPLIESHLVLDGALKVPINAWEVYEAFREIDHAARQGWEFV